MCTVAWQGTWCVLQNRWDLTVFVASSDSMHVYNIQAMDSVIPRTPWQAWVGGL